MSFAEMDGMMYKIEGEDLYLIGTSEHSMIGRFIDQILPEAQLPLTLTSYSPCFRKEKGAHGHRGARRLPHPPVREAGDDRRLPARRRAWTGMRSSGATLLSSSAAWTSRPAAQLLLRRPGRPEGEELRHRGLEPAQQKYFEVCSCSNLGDAQARRLKIRVAGRTASSIWPTR